MNDGEWLELANDLKQQYDEMKCRYQRRIAFLEQNNAELKKELGRMPPLQFTTNQFCSPRPTGLVPVYSSTHRLHLTHCAICKNYTC
jgi:hypothetical protein